MTEPSDGGEQPPRPLTSRRGFIAAASFGTLSLYAVWAAYGAAPFRLFEGGGHDAEAMPEHAGAGHAGHGEPGAVSGPDVDEFRRLSQEFIARNQEPDGSVRVGGAEPIEAAPMAGHDSHDGGHQAMAGMDMSHTDASHAAMAHMDMGHAAMTPAAAATGAPSEVYLLAQRWSFEPAVLRLSRGVPYRFRMMAADASHGASLQLGRGSRIIRLRQGTLVEQDLTFTEPGQHLIYCTVYCGIAHDRMMATLIVT